MSNNDRGDNGLSDKIEDSRTEEEMELLEELTGLDDPDLFREKKRDIEQKVQQEADLLQILHAKSQNANLEHALFFESLKHKLTEEGRQRISQAEGEEVDTAMEEFIDRLISVQLVINILKESPSFNDIAMRLDKISEFGDFSDDDQIVGEFEDGDFDFD